MEEKKTKTCPFHPDRKCTKECGLFIDPNDLNENVRNKLASLGVIDREHGACSLKNLSLSMNRVLYEEFSGFLR